jgi:hypothetical protein
MKNFLILVIASSLLVSSGSAASKKHKSKDKQKSFEPVSSADAGGYSGHYVGIESRYWVDIKVGPDNRLEASLYEDGVRVSLQDVKLTGSCLEATKVLAGGDRVPLVATFGESRVNGESTFGLLVEGDVRIDDDVVLNRLFYRRLRSTPGTAP